MLQLVGGLKAKVYLDKTDDLSFKNLCKKFWLRLKNSIAKSESQIYLYDVEASSTPKTFLDHEFKR